MPINVDKVRADTPSCNQIAHFNNAGASLTPDVVTAAVLDYLDLEATIGGYAAADQEAEALDRVYGAGARLLGCDADEIAFASSASEAWWRAFSAVRLSKGDTLIASRSEFVAGGIAMIQAAERGVNVVIVNDDEDGQIDVAEFEKRLDNTVKLVCLTHVPMTSGLVNPAAEIGGLTKQAGAYFLLDACQSVGQLPVDVGSFQCDFLTVTGRKWVRGPRGTGLLYVRQAILEELEPPTFIDGRAANWISATEYRLEDGARRYEFGEFSYAAKCGLGVALDYAADLGIAAIEARIHLLADRLRRELEGVPGVSVYDQGVEKCGIVTFTMDGRIPHEIVAALRKLSINLASPSSRTAALDIGAKGIPSVLRASAHYYNTDHEIDCLLEALASC